MTWVGAALFACGPAVEDDPAAGSGGGSGEGGGTTGVTTTTTATTEAVDSSEDDGSTGVSESLWCGADDPARAIAVLAIDASAAVLRADGTIVELALPPTDAPADASHSLSFHGRGDALAVARSWSRFADGLELGGGVGLFGVAGGQSWWRTEADVSLSVPKLGADGSIVATRGPLDGPSEGVLLTSADDALTLGQVQAIGPRRADGWIPAWRSTPEGMTIPGWISSTTLAFVDARHAPIGGWEMRPAGELAYLAEVESALVLVRERPDGAEVVPMPALAGADRETLRASPSPGQAWLLVREDAGRWWRIAIDDGIAEELDLTLPAGSTLLECYSPMVVIDDAGRLVVGTRDATAAAILRLEPASATWETLGERVTNVDDIGARSAGETYVVSTAGSGLTFCPPQEFEPGYAVLAGTTLQVVRPADGFSRLLTPDTSWASPSATGECVAIATPAGLAMLDAQRDDEMDLSQWQSVTWWSP